MKKKLFGKLVLLLVLSTSLVSCGQESNSTLSQNSSGSSSNHSVKNNTSETKHKETTKPQNSTDSKAKTKKTTKPQNNNNSKTKKNIKPKKNTNNLKIKDKETYYCNLIEKAWQKQNDYIDSIKTKQPLQTPHSAAIFKSNELLSKYPKDSKIIHKSLDKVLNNKTNS